MAKRKSKTELEATSNETTIDNKEIIENKETTENKESKENKEKKKENKEITNENKTEYIITKKTDGIYIRKLRRL